MPVNDPRDPPRSPTPTESNYSPRASLVDTSSHNTGSIRLPSPNAARRNTMSDMHRRVSRPSTLHRVTSGIRRLAFSQGGEMGSPEDWTVFGEAMAHEVPPHARNEPPSMLAPSIGTGESVHLTYSPVSELRPELLAGEPEVLELDDGSVTGQPTNDTAKDSIRESKSTSVGRSLLARVPALPTLYRNILKCSLAYFIGSLFTYYTPLSRFIVELTQDGPGEKYPSATGHMVATVYVSVSWYTSASSSFDIFGYRAVYYNPAKTIGGMIEADIYCIMGLGFASFISLGSMYTYWTVEPHPGWEWLADSLVLIWICVGMSLVAWFKLWIAKPTFNPGRSVARCF